jgi:ABC-type methionine transport system permease subunit
MTDQRELTTQEQVRQADQADQDGGQSRKLIIGLAAAVLVILVGLGVGIYLLTLPTTDTARIRDIFIILMALMSLMLGIVLIILVVQIARLTNLLQNEIKPILESTNETVSTLRGTTTFISDNLVQPVMKMNEYLAAITQLGALIGLGRRQRDRRQK